MVDNPISDASPLANLTELERLYLDASLITDFEVFKQLINLRTLDLQGIRITENQRDELIVALPRIPNIDAQWSNTVRVATTPSLPRIGRLGSHESIGAQERINFRTLFNEEIKLPENDLADFLFSPWSPTTRGVYYVTVIYKDVRVCTYNNELVFDNTTQSASGNLWDADLLAHITTLNLEPTISREDAMATARAFSDGLAFNETSWCGTYSHTGQFQPSERVYFNDNSAIQIYSPEDSIVAYVVEDVYEWKRGVDIFLTTYVDIHTGAVVAHRFEAQEWD